jgi:hypothetical protein
MTTYRTRGFSPPPPRRYADSRTSAGTVFTTPFDTRFGQQPRNSIDTLPSTRVGAEPLYDAQPISRRNYGPPGHSATQSKTAYAIRPRGNSNAGDEGRIPLQILPPPISETRNRPLVNHFPPEQPRSPLSKPYYPRDNSDRYILPAVSSPRHHRSQLSSTPADSSHLTPITAENRRERNGYRVPGSRIYPVRGEPVRYEDEDGYSYTTPHEQFDRDYPPAGSKPRRSSYIRQDRPTSVSDFDDWKAISQRRREPGPPPATRQLDKIDDADPRHASGRSGNFSDTERDVERPRRRHSLRAPVSVHQDREERYSPRSDERSTRRKSQYESKGYDDDPSYSSDREYYRPSSHYERHHQHLTSQEESRDRRSKGHEVAEAGLGGLAAGGLSSALVKKSREKDDDSDQEVPHELPARYAQDKDHALRDQDRFVEKRKDRAAELRDEAIPRDYRRGNGRKERSDSDSVDDAQGSGRRHRRKHRHHRRDSKSHDAESDSSSDGKRGPDVAPELLRDPRQKDLAQEDCDLPRRDRRQFRTQQRVISEDDRPVGISQTPEPEDNEEERAARLQLVEPPRVKEPDLKPKGILKPARQVPFPEDPNPTREGVAPLKDAGKKGIPPDARWTKIDRKLVNPAALEAAHERYEERPEYVIVLRVLSKEEVQQFADKTTEIRGKKIDTVCKAALANQFDRGS